MINRLVGGFVVIMIGVNLVKPISEAIGKAEIGSTGSSWANSALHMVPAFFALAVAAVGIYLCINGLRGAGLMEGVKMPEIKVIERIKNYFGYGKKEKNARRKKSGAKT